MIVVVIVYYVIKRVFGNRNTSTDNTTARQVQSTVPSPPAPVQPPKPQSNMFSNIAAVAPTIGAMFADPASRNMVTDMARLNSERTAIRSGMNDTVAAANKELKDMSMMNKIQKQLQKEAARVPPSQPPIPVADEHTTVTISNWLDTVKGAPIQPNVDNGQHDHSMEDDTQQMPCTKMAQSEHGSEPRPSEDEPTSDMQFLPRKRTKNTPSVAGSIPDTTK